MFVFNQERVNEKIHGLDGEALQFNKFGWARCENAALADHFAEVPGYEVYAELPQGVSIDEPRVVNLPDNVPPAPQGEPEADFEPGRGESPGEFVAGKSRADLEAMTKAELFKFGTDLGVEFESPNMTKAQMVDAILESGN